MSEWEETTLSACFDLVKKKASPATLDAKHPYVGMEHITPCTPRIIDRGRAGDVTSQVGVFQSGDVLFGRLRAYLRKVALADFAGVASTEVLILRPRQNQVLPGFLHLLASSPACINAAVAKSAGSRMPRTSASDLGAFPLLLPPLDEQRRIVDVMAAVDAQIEALEVEVERSRRLLTPLAQDVFDELGGETVRLGDVLTIVRGGSPRPIDNYFTTDSDGLNWIKIGDVARGGKYITQTAQKIKPEGLSKTRFVRAGSFLLSNSMSFGRPYILAIDGCIHDGWLSLTDEKNAFSPDFLYYLLRSQGAQEQFERLAAGSGVRNLNIKSVRGVVVSLPALAEQLEAVKRLNELTAIADAGGDELAALRAFRSTLLSSLLSQDVEIPESCDAVLATDLEAVS